MAVKHGREYALPYKCSKCGRDVDIEKYIPKAAMTLDMYDNRLCHHCAYWKNFFASDTPYEIVDGKIWTYGTQLFTVLSRRISVKIRYIFRPDGSVKQLNNSYCLGEVPPEYELPDTGRFVRREVFEKLEDGNGYHCRAMGCYDRYHCYWYHPEEWEKNGPWNVVPKTHKVGDEHCNGFLNKDTMFHL